MLDELGGAELEAFGDIGSIMPPRRRRSSSADAPQSPLDQAFGWRVQDSAKGAKVHTITGMEGDAALVSMSGSARAGLTASAIGTFRTLASPPPLSVEICGDQFGSACGRRGEDVRTVWGAEGGLSAELDICRQDQVKSSLYWLQLPLVTEPATP